MQTGRFQSIIAVMLALVLALTPAVYAMEGGELSPTASSENGVYSVTPDAEVITAITDGNGVSVDNIPAVTFPLGGEDLLYEKVMELSSVYAIVEDTAEPLELDADWYPWLVSTVFDTPGEYTAAAEMAGRIIRLHTPHGAV